MRTLRSYLRQGKSSPAEAKKPQGTKQARGDDKEAEDHGEDCSYSPRTKAEKSSPCLEYYVGAHLSIEGGVEKVRQRMDAIEGKAVAMFLKSKLSFHGKALDDKTVEAFRGQTSDVRAFIMPHISYVINLGTADEAKGKAATDGLLDEVRRCEKLGIPQCNLHPGSNTGKLPLPQACRLIADRLNKVHRETESAVILLENMAGQGNVVGSTFRELRMIIDGVEDKRRIGVCLDTAHLFGAGYDIRTKESFSRVMEEFSAEVGLEYLKGMHINDSKMPLGSKRDRHESIGKGLIGMEAFKYVMTSPHFRNIPLILETPDPSLYKQEVALLYSLAE